MLYKISQNKLSSMRQKKVLERQVQELVGDNLEHLLGLEMVCYEFTVEGKRIDILAFDREANAPVIIELKKENSGGLFDQGMEYFHLLSNRKADFLIKINEGFSNWNRSDSRRELRSRYRALEMEELSRR